MTSAAIQSPKIKVENFEQVGNEVATLRHICAGLEAENRRAHTEIAMLKLKLAGAPTEQPVAVDLQPVLARLAALESKATSATGDDLGPHIIALSNEIATLNSKLLSDQKRLADLERTVGQIGAQFLTLAAKAA